MKIKALFLAGLLALSMLCACGNSADNTNNGNANTDAISTESTGNFSEVITVEGSGNFSEVMIIEDSDTETLIVEMP